MPLLLAISVIPDVDLLFGSFMNHRGLTHSIITIGILAIPFFAKYKKAFLPYFAAISSHVFIGDLFTGGIEFLWPISKTAFGLSLPVNSILITFTELTLFCISLPLMYKFKDIQTLFKPSNRNFMLVVCCGAILGPLFWFIEGLYDSISLLLVVPSMIWLSIFAFSLLADLRVKFLTRFSKNYNTN
jgi:membrane-bound metal-dependent hydrolase YbcI (DUF457 family)